MLRRLRLGLSRQKAEAEEGSLSGGRGEEVGDGAAGGSSSSKAEEIFRRNLASLEAFRRGCEGALTEIAPGDRMRLRRQERQAEIYLYGGRSAFKTCIDALIHANAPAPQRILDFPCGHGRALRYLRAGFPKATLFAGDINKAALKFCRKRFGAETFLSAVDLSEVTLPKDMDLILCGSLVTHFSEDRAKQLIEMLCDALAPGGICLFSTHGRMYERFLNGIAPMTDAASWEAILADYRRTGYGYRVVPRFEDIQYGISLTKPAWIFEQIHARDDLTVLFVAEKAWHGQHDVTAIQKRALSAWYDPDFL